MTDLVSQPDFRAVVDLIRRSRSEALRAVNVELVKLYYDVGRIVSERITKGVWGEKTVDALAAFITSDLPELKGFSRRGLYRMRQFYETYSPDSECRKVWSQTSQGVSPQIVPSPVTQLQTIENQQDTFVSAVLTQISWTNHLEILTGTNRAEEKVFYLMLAAKEKLSVRELQRQIRSAAFERTMLGNQKLSPMLRELRPESIGTFRDRYIFEFLDLPSDHSEGELQKALLTNLKNFILEIGKGFAYLGNDYRLQIGNTDYYPDLLFYSRDLQCLVIFELKIESFKPEFLGKLNFYLEALDRDVRNENENPSIGILLCKGKNDTIVEYALARSVSPTVIADYETKLPDKKLLMAKLDEFAQMLESRETEQ